MWVDSHGNLHLNTQLFPPMIQNYIAVNLNTIHKVTNHILFCMAIANFFLFILSMRASFLTFLAASLLTFQTCLVTMVTNNDRISFAPQSLQPTEFMVGLCLGICVGGIILSFFLSAISGRLFSFCKDAEKIDTDDPKSSTIRMCVNDPLWSIWWFSSLICCSNILLSYFVAVGRNTISQRQQQQYSSIDNPSGSDVSSITDPRYGIQSPPSFQQDPQVQIKSPPPQQNDQGQLGGYPHTESTERANIMSL
mmetsp:Transcript_5048/g.11243  ORF Transcript_5048/g.11243 Transcript_5048/m.11243 type:complete len:251 (+) Transcript_5048:154-906(+)